MCGVVVVLDCVVLFLFELEYPEVQSRTKNALHSNGIQLIYIFSFRSTTM